MDKFPQEDITIPNLYAYKNLALKCTKYKVVKTYRRNKSKIIREGFLYTF